MSVPAIFWFLFLFAAAITVAVLVVVPESSVRARVSVDYVGATLLAFGLATLLLAISKGNDWDWSSTRVLGLFAAAFVSLTAFTLVERRKLQPLVDLVLVGKRPFADAHLCHAVFAFSFYLGTLVIPVMASLPDDPGYGLALSTTEIGLVLLPSGLAAMVSAWAGGRLVDRAGPRLLVACGSVLGIAAYAFLGLADWTAATLAGASGVLGLAWGFVLTGLYPVVIRSSRVDETSVAVAVNLVVRNTFLAVGVAVAFAVIEAAGLVGGLPAESGFTRVFLVGVVGACVTLALSIRMPGRTATLR